MTTTEIQQLPTPRTDKLEYEQECNFEVDWENHSRSLEQQLEAMKKMADGLKDRLEISDNHLLHLIGETVAKKENRLALAYYVQTLQAIEEMK